MNRIEIDPNCRETELVINGQRQEHVTSLDIQIRPREFPRISIEYNNNDAPRKAGFGGARDED